MLNFKMNGLMILNVCKTSSSFGINFLFRAFFFSRFRNKPLKIGGYNVNADAISALTAVAGDILIISKAYLMRDLSAL